MKKLLAGASVAALMLPAVAMAEPADSLGVIFGGTVEDVCTIQFSSAAASVTGLTGVVEPTLSGAGEDAGDIATFFGATIIGNSTDPTATDIGDISDIQVSFDATFFCNGDFQGTISSQNGGLVNSDQVVNTADFANALGYDVSINFEDTTTDVGPVDFNTATENQASATQQDSTFTGSQENGTVTVTIDSGQDEVIGGGNLISGLYQDALRFSFVQDNADFVVGDLSATVPDQATFVSPGS